MFNFKRIVLVTLACFAIATVFAQQPQTQTAPLFSANAKYANGVAPGYAPCASAAANCLSTTGLNLNIGPGTANCSGTIVTYAGGNFLLTASVTNYVYLNTASSCAVAVKTTAYTSSDIPIATVITGSSTVTSIADVRTFFNAPTPSGITALTGDGTASGPGSASFILATVNGGPGSCGDSTHVCQVTTNNKGLVTSQSAVAISGLGNAVQFPATGTNFYIDTDSRGAVSTTCILSATPTDVTITSGVVSSGVLTAQATNTQQAGNVITLSGFGGSYTGLNGQKVTILSAGLTTAQFEANVSAANGSTGAGAGGCTYNLSGQLRVEPFISGHVTVINGAVSSQTSAQIISNYSTSAHLSSPAVTGNPAYLVVQTGIQDFLNSGWNLATVEGNISTFLATARADNWTGIIMTTAIAHAPTIFSPAQSDVLALNAYIRAQGPTAANVATGQYWDKLVDTALLLPDYTDANYFLQSGPDAGHLTDMGAKVWADALNNVISNQQTPFWTQQAPFQVQGTVTYTATPTLGTQYSDAGKLVIMNCSSACTYDLNRFDASLGHYTQWAAAIMSIGSTTATITLTGPSTFNGTTAPTLISFQPLFVWLDNNDGFGYHYRGISPLVAGTGITLTPTATGLTIASTGSGTSNVQINGGSTLTNLNMNGLISTVCSDSSGSGTAQVCTTTPTFTPQAGNCIAYNSTTANTGAGLTLNVNSLGAKSIAKWLGSTTLTAGDLPANKTVAICYDGTSWELMTIGNAPGGSGTVTDGAGTTTANLMAVSQGTAHQLNYIDFPMTEVIPAANCNNATAGAGWSLPTSAAPTVACRTGSNIQAGVLQFAASQTAQFQVDLPNDYDSTGTVYAKIYFTQGANTTSGQTIIMQIATACSSTTDDPSFNAAQAFATATTVTTAQTAYTKTLSSVTMTGCTAGQNLNIKISRSGSDTAGTSPNVYWVALTIPRLLVNQAN